MLRFYKRKREKAEMRKILSFIFCIGSYLILCTETEFCQANQIQEAIMISSPSFSRKDTVLILSHPAAAENWGTYLTELQKRGEQPSCTILAGGAAAKKLDERKIEYISFDPSVLRENMDKLSEMVAKIGENTRRVITDCGHALAEKIHRCLLEAAPHIERVVYYDNPEPFVPGGYSEETAKAIQLAQVILFANKNLVGKELLRAPAMPISLEGKELKGIGYYPFERIEKLRAMRISSSKEELRAHFFQQHGIKDKGQKVVIYFGGANEEYYTKAFPAFCAIVTESLKELDNILFVIQQHPRAHTEDGDRDVKQLPNQEGLIISSERDSTKLLSFADVALYYQTSMAIEFVLANIPTIQIGHEPFNDLAVRSGVVPVVSTEDSFLQKLQVALDAPPLSEEQLQKIQNMMGLDKNWAVHVSAFLNT